MIESLPKIQVNSPPIHLLNIFSVFPAKLLSGGINRGEHRSIGGFCLRCKGFITKLRTYVPCPSAVRTVSVLIVIVGASKGKRK